LNVSDTFIRYVLQSENLPGKQMSMPTCIALGPTHGEYYAMYTTVENSDRYTYGGFTVSSKPQGASMHSLRDYFFTILLDISPARSTAIAN